MKSANPFSPDFGSFVSWLIGSADEESAGCAFSDLPGDGAGEFG
jgi:hypothetical protein